MVFDRFVALESIFSEESATFKRLLSIPPEQADAIIIFTGYGFSLCDKAHELWTDGRSKNICALGDNSYPWKANPKADAFHYRDYLLTLPNVKDVFAQIERTGNTKQVSDSALEKMIKEKWTSALLVVCWYHMPRAYSTFIKILNANKANLRIIPAPYEPATWNDFDPILEMTWTDALKQEKERMERYRTQGDVATAQELTDYLDRHFNQSRFIEQRFFRIS